VLCIHRCYDFMNSGNSLGRIQRHGLGNLLCYSHVCLRFLFDRMLVKGVEPTLMG